MQTTPAAWRPPDSQPPGPTSPPPGSPPGASQPKRIHRLSRLLGIGLLTLLFVGGAAAAVVVTAHERQQKIAAKEHRAEVAQKKAEERAQERAEAEEQEAQRAEEQRNYDAVSAEIEPLMSALTEIDARLNVGLNYADYAAMVGDVAVAYAGMDIDVLVDSGGLEVGAKLEDAYNTYTRAARLWNDNLFEFDSVESRMQKKWTAARTALETAKTLLADLAPDEAGSTGPSDAAAPDVVG